MAGNKEIELKLLIEKADLKKLLATELMTGVIRPDSEQKRRLLSSYYDTPDWSFKSRGIAYRVRSKGDGTFEATVKTSIASSSGLSERLELNLPLKSPRPQLNGFAEMGLDCELSELAPNGVNKLFTVNVQRTTYILDLDGAVAEMAVDHGRITAGENIDKIDEIEIELLQGEKSALFRLAAQIAVTVPVFVEKRSKFARGLALLGVAADRPAAKNALAEGELRAELLRVAALHGDVLLDLQNELRTACSAKLLKKLRRELITLRAELSMVGLGYNETLHQVLQLAEKALQARHLQELWAGIIASGKLELGRSSMKRRLAELRGEAEQSLQKIAVQGKLTAMLYAVTADLYQLSENNGTVLAVAKDELKTWQKELTETELRNNKLLLAENIFALARFCPGKSFVKIAESVKKERRVLSASVEREAWQVCLQKICEGATGKLIYRDAGLLLGYILALSEQGE